MATLKVRKARQETLNKIARDATVAAKAIRVMGKVLTEYMEQLHGGEFRVVVDHDAPFILIRRD